MVGIVTICHNINIGLNISKHTPYNITFAFVFYRVNNCASLFSQCNRIIGRIIIKNMNHCFWQGLFKMLYHLFNSKRFVVARKNNSNCVTAISPFNHIIINHLFITCIINFNFRT
ncbi:hypothetical protein HA42_02325 [Pantoea deleyi]|nr:hypothetical protein HA42_02325 [Pantoea deleyi]